MTARSSPQPPIAPGPAAGRVLVVGAGGVGHPAALALCAAGVREIGIADDDVVAEENLHRQILFAETDVGRPKVEALGEAIARRAPGVRVVPYRARVLPDSALALVRRADVVVDATDNFASRFLLADACALARVAVVHAACIRWVGTVLRVAPGGAPCYRCLFEDLPAGTAPDCATAGIVGPVCGVVGAVAAEMALGALRRNARLGATIATYDGLRDELRFVPVAPRRACPLCGEGGKTIRAIDARRYAAASCQA